MADPAYADIKSQLARLEPIFRKLLDRILAPQNLYLQMANTIVGMLIGFVSIQALLDPLTIIWSIFVKIFGLSPTSFEIESVLIVVVICLTGIAGICLYIGSQKPVYFVYSALTLQPDADFKAQFHVPEENRNEIGGSFNLAFRLDARTSRQKVVIEDIEMMSFDRNGGHCAVGMKNISINYPDGNKQDVWTIGRKGDLSEIAVHTRVTFSLLANAFGPSRNAYPQDYHDNEISVVLYYRTEGSTRRMLMQMNYQLLPIGIARRFRLRDFLLPFRQHPLTPQPRKASSRSQ